MRGGDSGSGMERRGNRGTVAGQKLEGRDAGRRAVREGRGEMGQDDGDGGSGGEGGGGAAIWRRRRRRPEAAAAAGGRHDDNPRTKQGEAAASAAGTAAARRGAAAEAAVGLPPCSSLSSHLRGRLLLSFFK